MTNIFFFSSRRRHTRSLCDWSSDVCSSDLYTRENWQEWSIWCLSNGISSRSEEHTSELQSHSDLVCRLLLVKNKYESLSAARESYCEYSNSNTLRAWFHTTLSRLIDSRQLIE